MALATVGDDGGCCGTIEQIKFELTGKVKRKKNGNRRNTWIALKMIRLNALTFKLFCGYICRVWLCGDAHAWLCGRVRKNTTETGKKSCSINLHDGVHILQCILHTWKLHTRNSGIPYIFHSVQSSEVGFAHLGTITCILQLQNIVRSCNLLSLIFATDFCFFSSTLVACASEKWT